MLQLSYRKACSRYMRVSTPLTQGVTEEIPSPKYKVYKSALVVSFNGQRKSSQMDSLPKLPRSKAEEDATEKGNDVPADEEHGRSTAIGGATLNSDEEDSNQ